MTRRHVDRPAVPAVFALLCALLAAPSVTAAGHKAARAATAGKEAAEEAFRKASGNGFTTERIFRETRNVVHAWLAQADPRTLLLPDTLPSFRAERSHPGLGLYTPHNSGADLYPYFVATAFLTDRALYEGRMREMLRNEIRYTDVLDGIPGNLKLREGELGPMSLFGAAEYCKDGMIALTELLGRTPWYYRMVDMTAAVMRHAPVESAFGRLPDAGAEVNGDLLQTLTRLAPMTGDKRFLEWAERIGDAYIREVLPRNHGLPGYDWDFTGHRGPDRLRLRDHGNEIVVGLVMLHTLENDLGTGRARGYRDPVARMLDRVIESTNADGMFFDEVRCSDLRPLSTRISDNWGYLYGSIYTFYMTSGETRYRDAVLRVLRNLPKYHAFDWENGRQDGYADAIESALYLANREPVPEVLDFIESEMPRLMAFHRAPDGPVEGAHPDGNWNRTALLYALYKTQGCYLDGWRDGVRLGAHRVGDRLYVSLESAEPWRGRLRFDFARHRRVMNLARNYVRVNEWPEWYTVDENALYAVRDAAGREQVVIGSDLKDGLDVAAPGRWVVTRR
jgi:hypothetical protein